MNMKMLRMAAVMSAAEMFLAGSVMADPSLSGVFGDSMILQRDRPIPVWGQAAANEQISVSLNGKTSKTTADAHGAWMAKLPAMKAGGPCVLIITGSGKSLTLTNVLIGDVWVCSGQSNMGMTMAGTGRGILDGERAIAAANYPNIRLFTVMPTIATAPKEDLAKHSAWMPCTPQSVKDFSAVAYFFGRQVHQQAKVPVGLILTAWGGTYAEAWTSRTGLATLPEFAQRLQEADANLPRLELVEAEFKPQAAAWEDQMDALDAGVQDGVPVWSKPECPTADWTSIEMPLPIAKLAGAVPSKLGGRVWLRRDIEVPASLQGRDLRLNLGLVRESGRVWFNGAEVSRSDLSYHFWEGHKSVIPANLVRPGINTIVVRSTDTAGFGGIIADPSTFELASRTPDSGLKPLNLAGPWLMKQGLPVEKLAPRPTAPGYWPSNPNMPTVLYNAMINPLVRTPIKGAIWYQGESNAGQAYEYRRLFPALIRDWRRAWGQGDFPFLYVQIASFGNWQPLATEPRECNWAELREAQLLTLSTPKTGMAVTIDIGEVQDIHPINKRDVGIRLGLAAQSVAYHQRIEYSGPLYQSMKVKNDRVHITFTHAKGLATKGGELKGFSIAGSDHKFRNARAEVRGGKVVVWSDAVPEPVAVRYGWDFAPECNLYNAASLPASPFRTDEWPGVTAPKSETGHPRAGR
jgi:sialate O-acetylesterase